MSIKVKGTISKINFPKGVKSVAEDEYAIFKLLITESDEREIVGTTISVMGTVNQTIKVDDENIVGCIVEFKESNNYGNSYNLIRIQRNYKMSNTSELMTFLESFMTSRKAKSLIDKYGLKLIDLIKNENIEELSTIKGIGIANAQRIIDKFKKNSVMAEAIIKFNKYDLTEHMVESIMSKYHYNVDKALEEILSDPYTLMSIDGIGFKIADKLALDKFNIQEDSPIRIYHAIEYVLSTEAENGKSYVNYKKLLDLLNNCLTTDVDEDVIRVSASRLKDDNVIKVFNNGENIALVKYYNLEWNIKNELMRILHSNSILPEINDNMFVNSVNKTEENQGFIFTAEQMETIRKGANSNILAITGLAGTGKTSVMKGICELYHDIEVTNSYK